MIFESLDELEKNKTNFSYLQGRWKKSRRRLNTKERFSAPLMVSAHQIKHLNKINELSCDAVVINLEDGVAPEQKPMALQLAALFISHLDTCPKKLIVRVNPLDEGGDKEIEFLNQVGVDAIRVPKVYTQEDVKKALGIITNGAQLHLSIETKEAWQNLSSLAVDNNVKAMYLGILDLFADLGLSQELIKPENPLLHYMLSHFLISVRSLGVFPVSFVYQEYKNLDMLQQWLNLEKQIGFQAKGVVSPDQAEAAMKVFADREKQLERARYIVKRFEEEAQKGITGFADDLYGFIDEPIYKGALSELGDKG